MNILQTTRAALLVVAAAALAACSATDDIATTGDNDAGGRLVIRIDEGTRVVNKPNSLASYFEQGDQIGIIIVKAGTQLDANTLSGTLSNGVWFANVPFTYNNGGLLSAPAGTDTHWPDKQQLANVDVYAYYPYSAQLTAFPTITSHVMLDQRSGRTAELLRAKTAGVQSGKVVALTFQHSMAIVQLKMSQAQYDALGGDKSVKMVDVHTGGTSDATDPDGNIANDNETGDINMQHYTDGNGNHYFRALVPEQTLPADKDLFRYTEKTGSGSGSGSGQGAGTGSGGNVDGTTDFGKPGTDLNIQKGTTTTTDISGNPDAGPKDNSGSGSGSGTGGDGSGTSVTSGNGGITTTPYGEV